MNFDKKQQTLKLYAPQTSWEKILDSAETKWLGPGSELPACVSGRESVVIPPTSIVLFERPQQRTQSRDQHATAKIESPLEKDHAHPVVHI
jgi:hypothetical protein